MKAMGFKLSFLIFGTAAAWIYIVTSYFIPILTEVTGQETILFWFICGGLCVFLPLLITAQVILKKEGWLIRPGLWKDRMRFKPITKNDIYWCFGGIALIGVFSLVIMEAVKMIWGEMESQPPFMSFEPLTPDRYWLLAVWLPYWILNIMGEEILWRGVMFPRQEIAFGNQTWIIHGTGWALFHIAFGWKLLLTMLPILYVQSFVIQKTKNSWNGVLIHALINGPSFIAISTTPSVPLRPTLPPIPATGFTIKPTVVTIYTEF